jgi:hypothetical protein
MPLASTGIGYTIRVNKDNAAKAIRRAKKVGRIKSKKPKERIEGVIL